MNRQTLNQTQRCPDPRCRGHLHTIAIYPPSQTMIGAKHIATIIVAGAQASFGGQDAHPTVLAAIARRLGVSIEELIDDQPKTSKRGPAPKLQQQMDRIAQLPRTRQQFVMQVIESVLAQRP